MEEPIVAVAQQTQPTDQYDDTGSKNKGGKDVAKGVPEMTNSLAEK